jgi:hypothetical protein
MALTDSTRDNRRVPRPRSEIDPNDLARIRDLQQRREGVQDDLERAVAHAFLNGASVRVLTDETGIAGTTVLRYVNKHRSES